MPEATAAPQTRHRYTRYLTVGAAVLAGVFLIWYAVRWTSSMEEQPVVDQVAAEWNATITRLGIDPIYPPQEDIVVGDIYLVVSKDLRQELMFESLLGKSLKIWHADLTEDLKQTYRQTYLFPPSPCDASDCKLPQATAQQGSIFDVPAERQSLPLALLPGFTAARIHEVSASGGTLSRWLEAIGALTARREKTIELKIPSAETYGVSAIMANKHLQQFCEDFSDICNEEIARRALSSVVGDKAFEKVSIKSKDTYRLSVEILLISRVYLARSIESVVYAGSRFGAEAKAALRLNEGLEQIEKQVPPPPSPEKSEGAKPPTDQLAALRRELAEQKARLQTIISQTTGAPSGGELGIQSSDDSRISVTQTFPRPVAIAFRAIRMKLPEKGADK
jgi:hypothetical protein